MMPERAIESEETLLSDDEIIERAKSDPELRRRAEELARKVASGELRGGPGITAEELRDFLRDRKQQ
jgi:hypothetical protein